jgi:hypothetical protein
MHSWKSKIGTKNQSLKQKRKHILIFKQIEYLIDLKVGFIKYRKQTQRFNKRGSTPRHPDIE